jgi:hypothetical protein
MSTIPRWIFIRSGAGQRPVNTVAPATIITDKAIKAIKAEPVDLVLRKKLKPLFH